MMSDYEVSLINDSMQEFFVVFHGPKETPFENGTWKIHVELPDAYPYRSPSIGFENKIYHPNIDENSGSVCLDVINQTWSPMFDIFNIFEVFLPQLLRYPNPTDPLNTDASSLLIKNKESYDQKVKDYVARYASNKNLKINEDEDDTDDELSSVSSLSDNDDDEEDEDDNDQDMDEEDE